MISVDSLFSQSITSSPYSRFGIGSLHGSQLPCYSSLGGAHVSYNSSDAINPYNPSTYSSFKPKSVLFSTGIYGQTMRISNNEQNQITNNTSLGHILLGMPITESISISTGLIPYSSVGYLLEDNEIIDDIGSVDYTFSGDGGLSNYYLGGSMRINDILSLGVNASYMFGGLNRYKTAVFENSDIFNTNVVNQMNITGISVQYGVLFDKELSNSNIDRVIFGVTFKDNSYLSAKRTLIGNTYSVNPSVIIKDTFTYAIDEGSIMLPQELSAGVSLFYSDQWMFIGTYSSQNWSDFEIEFNEQIETDSLANSVSFSAGVQYDPDSRLSQKYLSKMSYRLGAKYDQSYLQLRQQQILEKSISFGVGCPANNGNTMYNISLEVGERGTINDNLIKEDFLRFNVGVTFMGKWFVQRKYN